MPFTKFTNLDFDQIKTSIKDYLRANSTFTDFDFEGSNFSILIDTLAYNTYITAFNSNMIVNESFLDSATLRENVVSLARNIGYVPRSRTAAKATVSFNVKVADDNLTYDMKHSIEKFKAIKEENVIWCTPNGTMINKLTPELVQAMAESGLYQITLSMDSANAKTLKELHHKPVNLNSIPGLIEKCREYGVFTHGTLVVGMPGETIEEIKEGFDYVKSDLHFTSVSAFIAAAIPGSELYHEMLDQGRITREQARQIDTTKSKINININSNELEKEIENFQSDFMNIAKERDPQEYMRKYKKLIDSGRWDETQCGGKLT